MRLSLSLHALWSLCVLHAAVATEGPDVRARWVRDAGGDAPRLEVTGLDPARLDAARHRVTLRVFAVTDAADDTAASGDTPPMAGAYRVDGGTLCFEPRFPPDPGATYRAVVDAGAKPIVADFTARARRPAAATVVTHIYPTAARLPENLLKFYVHFSAPMRRGNIYDHIRLLDESGNKVELPFLEIDEELWDPSMTRLTLFIDPGRIKRGVAPLEEIGPALVAGKRFRLSVGPAWRDAAGKPLGRPFEKDFDVGRPDRDAPDPATWKITAPPGGARGPLRISFREPMDHALALRLIRVTEASGKFVPGAATLADGEREWRFVPDANWTPGRYFITARATVEDLAGNNIGKPFDVDLAGGAGTHEPPEVVTIPFEIR